MSTATSARGYKRPWLRSFNCMRPNNALQQTSGGLLAGASRPPSSMRRSQLNAVLGRLPAWRRHRTKGTPAWPHRQGQHGRGARSLAGARLVKPGVSRHLHRQARCRATPAPLPKRAALQHSAQAAGGTTEVTFGGHGHGDKRPWLQAPMATFHQYERPNDGMQLTSGGSMRAARASLMRRLQLIPVLAERW
jgi:hypothetical protein